MWCDWRTAPRRLDTLRRCRFTGARAGTALERRGPADPERRPGTDPLRPACATSTQGRIKASRWRRERAGSALPAFVTFRAVVAGRRRERNRWANFSQASRGDLRGHPVRLLVLVLLLTDFAQAAYVWLWSSVLVIRGSVPLLFSSRLHPVHAVMIGLIMRWHHDQDLHPAGRLHRLARRDSAEPAPRDIEPAASARGRSS